MNVNCAKTILPSSKTKTSPRSGKCVSYVIHVMPKLNANFAKKKMSAIAECGKHCGAGVDVKNFRIKTDSEKVLKKGLRAYSVIAGIPLTLSRQHCEDGTPYYIISFMPDRSHTSFYMCLESEVGMLLERISSSAC